MIGIIAAMKIEAEQLAAHMENKKTEMVSGVEYISGNIGGKEIVLAVCGIGKVFAAICAQTMALHYRPALIINTGVAGSLNKELSIMNIAVAQSVVQHDMDTSPLGDPVGFLSGINIVNIPCDEQAGKKIISCAEKLGLKCLPGVIASGDVFVANKEAKEKIVSQFGAIACEMEGAAIGQVCYVNQIPFVVIRAISDGANDDSSMDYPTFAKAAAEKSAQTLLQFIALA